ncbi:MAG: PAS domain S-box protein [Deltaproteobacteria bacterium]|nr:PAS domain S-box protein [Deltaproteobacteria bacterium]
MREGPINVLRPKLLAMMVLRVVLGIAFLGLTSWFQIKTFSAPLVRLYPLYSLVAFVGLLSIVYALAFKRIDNLKLFAYVQVTLDVLLITVVVYITGGVESYMHVLYPLIILGGASILSRRGGLYAAAISSICYGVLMDLDFYRMLPDRFKVFGVHGAPAWEDVFTTVTTNILAYFIIAYLTGYLAERTARVEKRLEEREIDFGKLEGLNRLIVENITSGIMTLDEFLRITSFNREAALVTGYTLRDVYYKDVRDVFPDMLQGSPGDSPRDSLRIEKRFKRKDGAEIFLGFTISKGQGGEAAFIVIFNDLTRYKAMEERLKVGEKLKALGELSVGIAHEIRNPLASISGSIQVLKDELRLSGDNAHLMEIVLRETDRLNRLITDYLLFARPATGKRQRVDLGAVINGTVKVFRNSPEAAGIAIKATVAGGIYVLGEERQLGQVFWNLFVNAAHAMSSGGAMTVTSRVLREGASSAHAGAQARPCVEILVADTGCGIKHDDLKRVFDPFFSTKDGGTGLGLAIVHRIIESHEGSIDVRSSIGTGTVFKVVLPLNGHFNGVVKDATDVPEDAVSIHQ